jgi:hypothetical protein
MDQDLDRRGKSTAGSHYQISIKNGQLWSSNCPPDSGTAKLQKKIVLPAQPAKLPYR